jgi:hypothetical protein
MAFDSARLTIPEIELLGVLPSEWQSFQVCLDDLLLLGLPGRKKCFNLLKNPLLPEALR